MFEKFQEHTRQIAALEARVDSLIEVLQTAGIDVPQSLAIEIRRGASSSATASGQRSEDPRSNAGSNRHRQRRLSSAAHADIQSSIGNIAGDSPLFRPGSPSNEELFEEMMRILGADEGDDYA